MTKYVLCLASELPDNASKQVEVQGRAIALFNIKGEILAVSDRCPHAGGSLCKGARVGLVQADLPGDYSYIRHGEIVRCPWHGWEFDLRTGRSWCDPKRVRVRSYDASVQKGNELEEAKFRIETFNVCLEEDYVVLEL
jgi:nitrite reductase/ring-hydroxylating ferredoxin subunit